jgi:hypothetical protein
MSVVHEYRFSKPSALERLHLLRTLDANDGQPMFTDADDAPQWYREEAFAFHRIAKRSKDNSTYYEWVAGKADHAADAETINVVIASIAGLIGQESLDGPTEPAPDSRA